MRYRVQCYLNFIAMELHANFITIRKADLHQDMLPRAVRDHALNALKMKYNYVDANWVKARFRSPSAA